MDIPAEKTNGRLMRRMFGEIASRYDFVTRAFSYGMDRRWKQFAVRKARLSNDAMVLDLACGTGDFSQIVLAALPKARVIAVDLTEPMLRLARRRCGACVAAADALALPFPNGCFDAVFVGYGMRNFPDLEAALGEIMRVTRPGGLLVTLDFFLPKSRVLRRLYVGYLYAQGAFWGLALHGRPRLYTYIPDSLRSFVSIGEFSSLLLRMGWATVETRAYVFGGIGLHWARRR